MKTIIISLKLFLILTALTGIAYPLLVTGIAQVIFPQKANGSMLFKDGQKVGSLLISQPFDSAIYFTSRPSAVSFNPLPSGGSNYGLTKAKLKAQVEERKQKFIIKNNLDSLTPIPSEMLFASACGLDPHISPEAAYLQVNRIAKARNYDDRQKLELKQLVEHQIEHRQFLLFGEERVNVLLLNLEVDKIK